MPNRQEVLYQDFGVRLQPRPMFDSRRGRTAIRVVTANGDAIYRAKPKVKKVKMQLTEAQDNAIGRAVRRRQNKRLRGWLPYAKR